MKGLVPLIGITTFGWLILYISPSIFGGAACGFATGLTVAGFLIELSK